jgi:myo-inositol-1(or 4)-monophosphatase
LIEKRLRRGFPAIAVLGEERISGDPESEARWVIDPIDGTVNFAYDIPHACVSVALQHRASGAPPAAEQVGYQSQVGVVYDPFCDELWTAVRGEPARLNGRPIHVSRRRRLGETIISVGFSKRPEMIERILPTLQLLIHRVRKIRMMGSAALALVYVASGRFDAYIEPGVRLWDIAAGGLIVECAGGDFWHRPLPGDQNYEVLANNGLIRRHLQPKL